MSDYTNAMINLGQSASAMAKPHVGGNNWMDAFRQGEQRSWRDYYDNYRDAFKRDDPTGYDNKGGYGAILAQYGTPQNQFYANMMQRQVDQVANSQKEWMDNYLKQQQDGQQQLFQWLQKFVEGQNKTPEQAKPVQTGPTTTTPPNHGGSGNYTMGQNPISRMPLAPTPPNFKPAPPPGGGNSVNPPTGGGGGGGGGTSYTSPGNDGGGSYVIGPNPVSRMPLAPPPAGFRPVQPPGGGTGHAMSGNLTEAERLRQLQMLRAMGLI